MHCKTLLLAAAFGLTLQSAVTAAAEPYKFIQEIPIGGEGGWDILEADSAGHRVFLSHSTKVVVVDSAKGTISGEIADTPGVHAFVVVPELGRGFSSNGKENKVSVVDLKTLTTTAKVDTGESPDAMAYDSKQAELYVFNHKGNSGTVIDAKTNKVVSTIPLEGSPEFGAADPAAGRVYVNIEDKSVVAVIDTPTHQVVAHWPLAPGEGPSGIALDVAHHRLFATCDKLMVMLDTTSGKVVGSVPTAAGADGCAFDPATHLVFASCGEGITTIAKEESPEKLTVVQSLKTERGARTMALDPQTHRIYLPTAQFEPAPSPVPGAARVRPKMVPNTMKLLVYGPAETKP